MKELRRRIKVTAEQHIGFGGYHDVYRISKRRVVKVPRPHYDGKNSKHIINDEVKGSKVHKFGLPVIDIIDVECPDGVVRTGTLRRYIPNALSWEQFDKLRQMHNLNSWDSHNFNYRTDSKGNLWRVDTQTQNIWKLVK